MSMKVVRELDLGPLATLASNPLHRLIKQLAT
jgi:hypothetical protein